MGILEKIEDKKLKGYLTVRQRIVFEGAIYHITQRAPGKELLFLEDSDYLYFLKLLKSTAKKFNLQIFCFSLLPNHLHLFLQINQENISQAMKNLFERYADYFNKKYKRKGHVFCGRYRASLCNDENYFLAASVYIHLNPYKAGLCKDFDDYRWSSLGLYLDKTPRESFVNPKEVLSILSSDIDKAKKEYLRILQENIKQKPINLLDPLSIKKAVNLAMQSVKKIIKPSQKEEDLDQLIDEFKIKKKIVNSEDKKVRKYLIEQLLANGYSISEILETLSIARTTYYYILNKSGQT